MAEGEKREQVLIVEYDADMAQMLEAILAEAGYEVGWIVQSPSVLEEVRRRCPDLLVVDLRPEEGVCRVLDELRADHATGSIPVVVTTTSEGVCDCALASYNVRAFFTKPFDLEVFLGRVREALGQPPLHALVPPEVVPVGLAAQAERILAEHSREAILRWAQRLRQRSPWRERQDLRLPEILDNVPALVETLVIALCYGSADELFDRHPLAVERVQQHAVARRRQGFSLAEMIREYALLRDELSQILWRHLPAQVERDDALAIAQALNAALDRAIELTVPAYTKEEEREAA